VQRSLRQAGIDFRLWYGEGLHRQTYFANMLRDALRVTDSIAPCLLGLPMAPDLGDATVARVVGVLASGLRH
jgi:dTDP-4-amino-4,6-dideoxygalactose transaminase